MDLGGFERARLVVLGIETDVRRVVRCKWAVQTCQGGYAEAIDDSRR